MTEDCGCSQRIAALEARALAAESLGSERDRRYEHRFEAQQTALGLAQVGQRAAVASVLAGLAILVSIVSIVVIVTTR